MGHMDVMDVTGARLTSIELKLNKNPNDDHAKETSITLSRTTNMEEGIHNLFCYSSLVQNTTVGDVHAPLLRIVPVQGDVGDYLYETFEDRQYIPLQSNTFNVIEVLIGDRFGKRVKFNPWQCTSHPCAAFQETFISSSHL